MNQLLLGTKSQASTPISLFYILSPEQMVRHEDA